MKISRVFVVFTAVLLAACATFKPTPYQASVDGGYGYSDEQLAAGEYRITVSGNAATPPDMLWEQLLFRAAEITLADRRKYFIVVPNAVGRMVDIKPAFLMPQFGIGPGARVGVRMPLVRYEGLPIGVEPSRQLIATATISLTENIQEGARNAFDAKEVRGRLEPAVVSQAPRPR